MARLHIQQISLESSFDFDGYYDVQDVVGEGTYGVVYSALHESPNQKVAIKKLSPFHHSMSCLRALREIKLLRYFRHENNASLLDVYKLRSYEDLQNIYLIQGLMETNLLLVIETQYLIYRTLRGLRAIHSADVLRRDLKASHLLVNAKCDLKICNFGLARSADSIEKDRGLATENVGTHWYRAPEVMLSFKHYTKAIDVWSVGCILAERLGGKPLFPGDDYNQQLTLIFDVLGTPNAEDYYAIVSRNARKYIRGQPLKAKTHWKEIFPVASDPALDLLERLLIFNPTKRITAAEALKHPYFKQYHEPEDELTAAPVPEKLFDFDKPSDSLSEEQLRSEKALLCAVQG